MAPHSVWPASSNAERTPLAYAAFMPPPSMTRARLARGTPEPDGAPRKTLRRHSGLMSRRGCGGVVWGIAANAATTGLAAAAYAAAAVAAQRRQRRMGRSTSAAPLLFATIAVYLAVASLRQVAAFLSADDPAW